MDNELEVKSVDFMGNGLIAAKDSEGTIWASVSALCKGMGLTKDQIGNERKKIQGDLVLSKGQSNLTLPTNGGNQEVLCLQIDYVPLWLAKISITPNMKETNPELVETLVNYQLKAKDVLAAAFLPQGHNVKQLTITSRDIARIIGKIHGTTLTIIRDCIKELSDMGFNTTEFFQQSTYHGGNNQEILQYLCTERGCDYFSGHLEPDIRKMFIADFKGRFERMRNVVDGKPVNDVTNKNLIGTADMPEQEPVIRLFESNTGSVLLIDNDVYGLMPEETETVRRLIPELEKNGVNQIKKVLIAILESGTKSGKLTEITSWRLENEETEPEKPDIPKKREKREDSVDLNNVETLSTEQAKVRYGLGYDAIQRAARECGAIVRMGNRRLYSRRKLDKYFESLASSV